MTAQGEALFRCLMPVGPRIGQGGPAHFILREILPPEASDIGLHAAQPAALANWSGSSAMTVSAPVWMRARCVAVIGRCRLM